MIFRLITVWGFCGCVQTKEEGVYKDDAVGCFLSERQAHECHLKQTDAHFQIDFLCGFG